MASPPVLNCNVASVATWTSCAPRSVSATQSHSVVVYGSVCHCWLHYASFISFLKTLPRWPLRWQMPAAQHPGRSTAPLLSRSLQSGYLSMLLRGSGFCRLRCTSALTAAGQEVSHRCSLWATWISHGASATHNQQNTRPSSCRRRPYHAPGRVAEYWIALSVCSRNWGQNPRRRCRPEGLHDVPCSDAPRPNPEYMEYVFHMYLGIPSFVFGPASAKLRPDALLVRPLAASVRHSQHVLHRREGAREREREERERERRTPPHELPTLVLYRKYRVNPICMCIYIYMYIFSCLLFR